MFRLEDIMGRRVLRSSLIDCPDVDAFFTTRDLPLKFGEKIELAAQIEFNKQLLCKTFNIPSKNLLIPNQTHSDVVKTIKTQEDLNKNLDDTDALVTNLKNVALALNFADCVPIILFDSTNKVIAAAHAGWRGTVSQIGAKTVKTMKEEFNSDPKNIIALIGPAIGQCCFEVGEEVLTQLKKACYSNVQNAFENNKADLKLINKSQLLAMGVEKIDLCEDCTSCKNELFFSYRKENANTQRHSAVIIMKETR